jgi:predicted transglutaminase-like cysteine proteinase
VSGIVIHEEGNSAVINNKIVMIGDLVDDMKVRNINELEVELVYYDTVLVKKIGQGCKKVLRPNFTDLGKVTKSKITEKKQVDYSTSYGEELYRKAMQNYALAQQGYDISQMMQAYIYYEKAIKYAQAALPYLSAKEREELGKMIMTFREKSNELDKEREKINRLELANLKSYAEISSWLKNHVVYRDDFEFYGQGDYWQTPRETIALGYGDCEDFAFLAQAFLKEIGVESSVYGITYVKGDKELNHAICLFPEGSTYNYYDCAYFKKTSATTSEELINSLYHNVIRIQELNLFGRSRVSILRQ